MKKILASKLLFLAFMLTQPIALFAAEADDTKSILRGSLRKTGTGVYDVDKGSEYTALSQITGGLLFALSSLIGTIFLALTVYGGYKWMQAKGSEDEVKEALGTIRHGIIGMAIVLGAHLILKFVLEALFRATGGP